MSATLTWRHVAHGSKTGTGNANLLDDIEAVVNTKSGDANYKWQIASKDTASNPMTLVLKRKDGSAGRGLFAIYTASPANNNPAVIPSAPSLNGLYMAWFPNGNTNSPSNITAASGAVMGDDTNALKFVMHAGVSTIYSASIAPFYFECDEAFVLGLNNPAATTAYINGFGKLFVDGSDNAYDGLIRGSATSYSTWMSTSSSFAAWTTTAPNPGGASAVYMANYGGSTNVPFYHAWTPSGAWSVTAIGANDVLTDTANAKAWFVPVPLLSNVKGQGFALKLRQIAIGPTTTAAFTAYSESGPVVAARQHCGSTTGSPTGGMPWFTNFKL